MRMGLVLLTYISTPQRQEWAKTSFASLKRTLPGRWEEPLLFIAQRTTDLQGKLDPVDFYCDLTRKIDISYDDPPTTSGAAVCLATDQVLALHDDITHVCWIMDDCVYHPEWMRQLEELIERHPAAQSWSVFRSSDVSWHFPLVERNGDVWTKSLSGEGKTFTREEWDEFAPDWREESWDGPVYGASLDIHHAWVRPGEYWCTRKSYINHIGTVGEHARDHIPTYALEFAGE